MFLVLGILFVESVKIWKVLIKIVAEIVLFI